MVKKSAHAVLQVQSRIIQVLRTLRSSKRCIIIHYVKNGSNLVDSIISYYFNSCHPTAPLIIPLGELSHIFCNNKRKDNNRTGQIKSPESAKKKSPNIPHLQGDHSTSPSEIQNKPQRKTMATQLQIPPLVRFVLRKGPKDKSIGMVIRQGADDAVEGEFLRENAFFFVRGNCRLLALFFLTYNGRRPYFTLKTSKLPRSIQIAQPPKRR